MNMFHAKKFLALLAAFAFVASVPNRPAFARIESLDLPTMMRRCDNAVFGEIIQRHVFFVDEPNGPGLFFTTLTLEGYSLKDKVPIQVDVTIPGGFLDEETGVHNSEAPSADDTAVGTRAIVFYKWMDNMGGGVSGNAVYAAKGGLFRAVDGPLGAVALGRGDTFAVARNMQVSNLESAVRQLAGQNR